MEIIPRIMLFIGGLFIGGVTLALLALPSTNPDVVAATRATTVLWIADGVMVVAMIFLIIAPAISRE